MASFFQNFLTGVFGADGYMKDYAHAANLYREDNFYDLAPKAGWLYYVRMGINPAIRYGLNKTWQERFMPFVGILAKSVDTPSFRISTETLNQYNRKVVIQTKLNYAPLTITFHDDMANATTDLWRNYYQYYYGDGRSQLNASLRQSRTAQGFSDNKYDSAAYAYGLANLQDKPFFNSIEIFQLNKKKFTSFTLVNPIIKDFAHSNLDQSAGTKLAENRMTVEYETVIYSTGKASQVGFDETHYDKRPSPLRVAGNGNLFGPGGIINGATEVFGEISNINENTSFLDILGTGIKAAQLSKNISKVSTKSIKAEGYSILTGQLARVGQIGAVNYANELVRTGVPVSGLNVNTPGLINLFKQYPNDSVNPSTPAAPRDLAEVVDIPIRGGQNFIRVAPTITVREPTTVGPATVVSPAIRNGVPQPTTLRLPDVNQNN